METFHIPQFVDNYYDDEKSCETFSSISQEFDPIDVDKFPIFIKKELDIGRNMAEVPSLLEHEVYEKILKAKKPHSMVPEDLSLAMGY